MLLASWQMCEALVPVVVGLVLDRSIAGRSSGWLVAGVALLAVTFAVLSTSFRWASRLLVTSTECAAHDLRLRVVDRVVAPAGGIDAGRGSGAVLILATADTAAVASIIGTVAEFVAALAALSVATVLLLTASLQLGVLVIVGLPVLLLIIGIISRPIEGRSREMYAAWGMAAGVATDLLIGVRVLKGIHAESAASDRYREASRRSRNTTMRSSWMFGAHLGATETLNGIFLAAVAVVGGRLALDGSISIGALIAALGLTQFLIGPFSMLGSATAGLAEARGSANRLASVLNTPSAVDDDGRAEPAVVRGTVEFASVTSGPVGSVSFTAAAGRITAVVADPPTTARLVALLMREVDPESGTITLDDVAVADLPLDVLRHHVVVAPHEAILFDGTIRSNIDPSAEPSVPDDDGEPPAPLRRAASAAAVDDVVSSSPDGWETSVGDRGQQLSGGQRQRVALARALARDSAVLVLHEPTTAIDPATERAIVRGLADVRRGRTTILATTSPALLDLADRVVVVRDGEVVGVGGHAELVRSDTDYRQMVLA